MKRTFTSEFYINRNESAVWKRSKRKNSMSPKKETLDFLRQFARSYHIVGTGLPAEISGMVLS